jgi:hypothetical protein
MATIQGVYVALFGRPADPTGLTFFKGVTNDGADLSAIGDLSTTKEYTDRFVGQTNVQIINSIYQSLFGHPADAAGLNFFIGELLAGRQTIQTIAINILDGAQGTDKEIVDRKIAAADAFTAALDTTAEIVGYTGNAAAASGVAFLATVTATAPTAAQVDAAVAAAVAAGGGAAGNTFTLTTTVGESVMGTSADDTFSATTNKAGLAGTPAATFNTGDMVDGAGGNDTFNIIATGGAGAATVPAGAVKNVEIVNLVTDTAGDNFVGGTANAANFMGVTQLWQKGPGTTQAVTGVTDAVTVGFGNGAAINNVATATGAKMVSIALDGAATGGTSVITEGGAAGTLTTVNVNGSLATSGTTTINSAVATVTDVNIGVSTAETFTLGIASAKTVDASASTGAVTIAAPAAVETLKGGSGNDILTGGGAASKLIEGGAGNDNITAGGGASEVINGGANGTANNTGAVLGLEPAGLLADAILLAGGAQTIVTEAGHSGLTLNTADWIVGFGTGVDKLDFNLAAGSGTNFLNGGASSGHTDALTNANTAMDGTVQYFASNDATNTYVFVDVDLDGTADMGVTLQGVVPIVATDIIA